jgi:hypothetical protein
LPVTITLPAPGNVVSPFTALQVQSDFVGPLPLGSHWITHVYKAPEPSPANDLWTIETPTATPFSAIIIGKTSSNSSITRNQAVAFKDGDTANITVELAAPSSIVDSGTVQAPWQSDAGQTFLPDQITAGTGGGLTDAQAQELTETHASTFPDQLVDNLTLIPLASVPTQGPVNANLLDTTFGVIVRLASIPGHLVPQTPDGDYWIATLAVVRIFRGSDLWKRYPIHTSNRLISFLDESIVASVTALTATQWLLNMTIQVTFLEGVTGTVFLMRFP